MNNWFKSLNNRERLFILCGTVITIITLVWFGAWMPLNKKEQEVFNDLTVWEDSLIALQPLKGKINESFKNIPIQENQESSILVIVDRSIRSRDLHRSLQRSQPIGNGDGIRVDFQDASFDNLILWLGDIHNQYGLDVISGSFSPTSSGAGKVNSNITIEY